MNKTILYLTDDFHIGGVTSFLLMYSQVAAELGYSVVIFGAKGNLDSPKKYFPHAKVYELMLPYNFGTLIGRFRWTIDYLRALHDIYAHNSIDIIHAYLPYSLVLALLHPFTWSRKKIYSFCGDVALEIESAHMWKKSVLFYLRNSLRYAIQRIAVYFSNRTIVYSRYARRLFSLRYPDYPKSRIVLISPYVTKSKHIAARKPVEAIRLLTITRFEPRKGIENVLKAVSLLVQAGVNVRLVIAGPYEPTYFGIFFKKYEELNLFTRVQFVHKVSPEQIEWLYANSDIYINPTTQYETFGLITLHALSRGIPVIGMPTGATPEILRPIDERLIAKTPDASGLADAIGSFVSLSGSTKRNIQSKTSAVLKKSYAVDAIKNAIAQLYQT